VETDAQELTERVQPVRVHYRECGAGTPLVFLHGGWGYEIYPFDRPIAALAARHRIIIPDRSGYGRSTPIQRLEPRFHEAAALETRAVIDALDLRLPVLWGHSDGAVIAALIALAAPARIGGLVLEASHLSGDKPGSRAFFEMTARDPDSIGDRAAAALARDHGREWRQVVVRHSLAWLELADAKPAADFYGGRLGDLQVRTLIVHGARDPRTEPGELDAICSALPHAARLVLPEGGHSPHSERASADAVASAAVRFLA